MKNILFGNEVERMPDFVFRFMKLLFAVFFFFRPARKYLSEFGIKPGFTVVDYGCGTGAYIKDASEMAGDKGTVYAVDVHELAIKSAKDIIRKHNLLNVIPVLSDGKTSAVPDNAADLVYALDMFHMVKDPCQFLRELNRITRKEGILIIEDGHQPRSGTKEKITKSGCWNIVSEGKRYLRCTPAASV